MIGSWSVQSGLWDRRVITLPINAILKGVTRPAMMLINFRGGFLDAALLLRYDKADANFVSQ
ncbi:hypothetical protein Q2941_01730 [Bradyrhizobium sp. UFLA05-153]